MHNQKWDIGKFSWGRPIKSYAKYHRLYTYFSRNRAFQLKSISAAKPLYLHVGCGTHFIPGFINIDYNWQPGVDLCWDITGSLPFQGESVDGIFTEHCLEHFPFMTCAKILSEFFRILRPGATLRLVIPDAGKYLDLYQEHKHSGHGNNFPNATHSSEPDIGFFTPMMAVNRAFRDWGHLYAYDAETMGALLRRLGFSCATKSYKSGVDKMLLMDQEGHMPESLYVEAYKP